MPKFKILAPVDLAIATGVATGLYLANFVSTTAFEKNMVERLDVLIQNQNESQRKIEEFLNASEKKFQNPVPADDAKVFRVADIPNPVEGSGLVLQNESHNRATQPKGSLYPWALGGLGGFLFLKNPVARGAAIGFATGICISSISELNN